MKTKFNKLFTAIVIIGMAIQCNNPDPVPCVSDSVNLSKGNTVIEICAISEVPNGRVPYALEIATLALPLIENFHGSPYLYDRMQIELGHNFARGGTGKVLIGGGGHISTIDWLMIHEMIHSFWSSSFSPVWMSEGSANSGATIIRAEVLGLNIDHELWSRRYDVMEQIVDMGYENTLLVDTNENYAAAARLGDVFLIDMYFLLGRDNLENSYQELYEIVLENGFVDECDIASVLYNNCPVSKRSEFSNIINERIDSSLC
jgi:hypothetical protein